jgi:hypothetical protein
MCAKKKLKSVTLSPEVYDVWEKDHRFVEHIRKHLEEMGLKDVMCKICNKTIDAILAEGE